jgi:hypothetical protein
MMTMIMYIIVPSTICSVSVRDICITGDLTFCGTISSSPADSLRSNPIFWIALAITKYDIFHDIGGQSTDHHTSAGRPRLNDFQFHETIHPLSLLRHFIHS